MRKVRVGTIAFNPNFDIRDISNIKPEEMLRKNVDDTIKLIDRISLENPDIVCLPEEFNLSEVGCSIPGYLNLAEEITGRTVERISKKAKEHNMYIICPILEKKNNKLFNSSVVIDRVGKVIGAYHKMHLTDGEMENGYIPGEDKPIVFSTDFGKIGIVICFDLNFESAIENLSKKKAEIIFFPSMFAGGFKLQYLAFKYNVCFVSSYFQNSMIVDITGKILAETGYKFDHVRIGYFPPIAFAEINLDRKVLHIDYNSEKFDAIKMKYKTGVNIDLMSNEGLFVLESNLKDISVDDIIKEFKLEFKDKYFERVEKIRGSILNKERKKNFKNISCD